GGQTWAQEAIVGSGEEQGDAQAEVGDEIAEAVRHALDQAMQAKPTQLVGHRALGDRRRIVARQGGQMPAQIGCPEALRKLPEQDEGMQERLNAWVGEAQA